jgi:hypothetical protein
MSVFRVTVVLYFIKILQKCNIIHDFKNLLNGGCMVKRGGGLVIFVSKRGGGGGIGGGLEREMGTIPSTVPPFLPLPSQTCCRRGGNCRG